MSCSLCGRRRGNQRDPYQYIDNHQLLSLQWLSQPLNSRVDRREAGRGGGLRARESAPAGPAGSSERFSHSPSVASRGDRGRSPRPAVLRASAKHRWLPTRFSGLWGDGRRSRAGGEVVGEAERSSGVVSGVRAESFDAGAFLVAERVGGRHGRRGAGGLAPAHACCERLLRVEAPAAGTGLRGCAAGLALERGACATHAQRRLRGCGARGLPRSECARALCAGCASARALSRWRRSSALARSCSSFETLLVAARRGIGAHGAGGHEVDGEAGPDPLLLGVRRAAATSERGRPVAMSGAMSGLEHATRRDAQHAP